MMRQLLNILFLVVLGLPSLCVAQSDQAHDLRRQGDRSYDKKEFLQAEEAYRKSGLLESTPHGSFNLGNSIFKQRRYGDASEQFEKAQEMAPDNQLKADSWYNLGNAKYLNGEYEPSVQAYKEALKLNPQDLQAKQNLLMALREMEQEQQQKEQQQDQQEQEEQDKQEEQQEQQQQQDQQQQQQSQGNEDDNPQEDQQQQQQEQQLSKEQAMQLLKIIEEEDQKVQEKMRQGTPQKKKEKDW